MFEIFPEMALVQVALQCLLMTLAKRHHKQQQVQAKELTLKEK